MTTSLESSIVHHENLKEKAIEIIDEAREQLGERFEVQPLSEEFAFLARRLGEKGLWVADAATNRARTFKARGAYVKMALLAEQNNHAVIGASAGNHLAGVALAGRLLGTRVTMAVPQGAPAEKLDNARSLYPDTSMFDIRKMGATVDYGIEWAKKNPRLGKLVLPFDDPEVVAGQGTIADDLYGTFKAMGEPLQNVVVPIGGGGLLAGVAERLYQLDPRVTVHGVEVEGSDSLSKSKKADQIVKADRPNKHFSGLAVRQTGALALDAVRTLPNIRLFQVTQSEVEEIANEYLEERASRILAHRPYEPTSLVALAGLAQLSRNRHNKNIAVVGTGRNESVEAMWN